MQRIDFVCTETGKNAMPIGGKTPSDFPSLPVPHYDPSSLCKRCSGKARKQSFFVMRVRMEEWMYTYQQKEKRVCQKALTRDAHKQRFNFLQEGDKANCNSNESSESVGVVDGGGCAVLQTGVSGATSRCGLLR